MPHPIVAPQLVTNGSVVAQRQLDLAVSQIESQQGDDSAAACVEDQPFGRLGVDVEGEVGPDKDTRQTAVRGTDCRCCSLNVLACYVSGNTAVLPVIKVSFWNSVANPAVSLGEVVLAALHLALFTPTPCRSLDLHQESHIRRLPANQL